MPTTPPPPNDHCDLNELLTQIYNVKITYVLQWITQPIKVMSIDKHLKDVDINI